MNEPDPTETSVAAPRAPRPAGALPACLVHIYPPGTDAGRRYQLPERALLIGRADDRDIRIDDPSVSRRHARVVPAEGGHAVEDLGSTNGTHVNDEPVGAPRALADGDYLRVGNRIYRYLAGGNVEAEYHEEIYRLAVRDGLTGLANRRALNEFLEREVARSARHARPLSVVLCDVDRFKSVNDTHGHLCGDAVLRAVADALRGLAREEDLCARYGGEEFALVLAETEHDAAVAVAERARAAVERLLVRTEDVELRVTVSAGVATTCGDAASTPAELLFVADGRLYEAKRAGRNRVLGATGESTVSLRTDGTDTPRPN
jgi:diguanylate cyclase (GGDEF)-like protein